MSQYTGNLNVYGTYNKGQTWTLIRRGVGPAFVEDFKKVAHKWDELVFSETAPGEVTADLSGQVKK